MKTRAQVRSLHEMEGRATASRSKTDGSTRDTLYPTHLFEPVWLPLAGHEKKQQSNHPRCRVVVVAGTQLIKCDHGAKPDLSPAYYHPIPARPLSLITVLYSPADIQRLLVRNTVFLFGIPVVVWRGRRL